MNFGNRFLIGIRADKIAFFNPPKRLEELSKEDALLLAAWIVALADEDGKFDKILDEVLSS